MQVTLKKASELSRSLIAAAKAVEFNPTAKVSPYSDTDPMVAVGEVSASFDAATSNVLALLDTGYALRVLIASHNAETGIDNLLTQVKLIDEKVERLNAASTAIDGADSNVDGSDAVAVAKRVEIARAAVTDKETRRYSFGDDGVEVAAVGKSTKGRIADAVASLKRHRATLKDNITALNFSTKVTLDQTALAVLRAEKLID